ncbi:DUF4349 domain-containing protein [Mucilaginibacter sp.]|uniref:DUF4349 domain-containing protein n=1 Tax=Mucilaginibacter sp. TaxID=1882438 RepID=UPI003D12769F
MKTQLLIPLLAGVVLLDACKGKGSSEAADTTGKTGLFHKSSISKTDTMQIDSKLVRKADMHFKVKNVQQTSERIVALTNSCNGMVIHHVMNATPGNTIDIKKSDDSLMRVTVINTVAEMTVKIPPASLENFMNQVARLGIYVNNSNMDITDKSAAYLSTQLKLKNQRESLNKQEKNSTGNDNVLAFKNSMVDQQMINHKIDDSVKTSTITLSFYDSNVLSKEIIANDDLSAYNVPFMKRMGMALENGWDVFMYILISLANFWVLLPLGCIILFAVRYYKSKKVIEPIK